MSCSPSLSFSPLFTVPLTLNPSPSQTPYSHDAIATLAILYNLIGQRLENGMIEELSGLIFRIIILNITRIIAVRTSVWRLEVRQLNPRYPKLARQDGWHLGVTLLEMMGIVFVEVLVDVQFQIGWCEEGDAVATSD
ncbi:hypothetical protein Tco_0765858 [Tanacetum coccineum]